MRKKHSNAEPSPSARSRRARAERKLRSALPSTSISAPSKQGQLACIRGARAAQDLDRLPSLEPIADGPAMGDDMSVSKATTRLPAPLPTRTSARASARAARASFMNAPRLP